MYGLSFFKSICLCRTFSHLPKQYPFHIYTKTARSSSAYKCTRRGDTALLDVKVDDISVVCDGKYKIQSGSYDKDFFYAELFLIFPSYIHSISSSAYKYVRRGDTGLLNITVDDDISVMCDGIYDIQSGYYDKGSVARPLFP